MEYLLKITGLVRRKNIDYTPWPEGPWSEEPDLMVWRFPEVGYLAAIVRQAHSGHLCGYVAAPKDHPVRESDTDYDGFPDDLVAHGGVTFFGGVPSVSYGAELSDLIDTEDALDFWVGFDCAHSGDARPGSSRPIRDHEEYKGVAYTRHHVKLLARQMWELEEGSLCS